MAPATTLFPSQPQQEPTLVVIEHLDRGEKLKGNNLRTRLPKILQPLRPQSRHFHVLCVKLLDTPPIIVRSFLILKFWFMKHYLSQISLNSMLTDWFHPRNYECYTQITLVPCDIIMVIIPIVALISMNFAIALRCFVNMRPLIVEHLLLYSWILIPLVNQNRGTLVPPS